MKAENGKRVKVQFIGRLDDGSVFGEATAEQPLEFTLGREGVIPGFVDALIGMEPGETKMVHLLPEDGFGCHEAEKIINFNRRQLAKGEPLVQGSRVVLEDVSGREYVGRVEALSPELVTVDMNHPLAGKSLDIEIGLQEVV